MAAKNIRMKINLVEGKLWRNVEQAACKCWDTANKSISRFLPPRATQAAPYKFKYFTPPPKLK